MDYFSREDALNAFGLSEKTRKYGGDHSGYDTRMLYEIQNTLESLPAADVDEVIRCKECAHWNAETKGCKRNPSVQPWYENDFCNYGERLE